MMHNTSCGCARCRDGARETFEVMRFAGFAPLGETEEMELAMELLSVASEEELEQFLGKLVKGAWRGIKKVGRAVGKIAKPLAGALRGLAKTALPFVGGALGSFIPIPGVGTALGSALGGALSKALEMEMEGVDPEQHEFEMARRFVRVAADAAQQAALAPAGADPADTVQAALTAAMRTHLREVPQPTIGRWRRRRGRIVLEM